MSDARLEDDSGPGVYAVEEADTPASLFVRVGPVYDGVTGQLRRQPGVWIEYMTEHMNSSCSAPMLLTPQVWYQLAKAVDKRLQRRSRRLRGRKAGR
jgi:hypothetical protein